MTEAATGRRAEEAGVRSGAGCRRRHNPRLVSGRRRHASGTAGTIHRSPRASVNVHSARIKQSLVAFSRESPSDGAGGAPVDSPTPSKPPASPSLLPLSSSHLARCGATQNTTPPRALTTTITITATSLK